MGGPKKATNIFNGTYKNNEITIVVVLFLASFQSGMATRQLVRRSLFQTCTPERR